MNSVCVSRLTADLASLPLTYTQTRTQGSPREMPPYPMRSQSVPKQLWSTLMVRLIDCAHHKHISEYMNLKTPVKIHPTNHNLSFIFIFLTLGKEFQGRRLKVSMARRKPMMGGMRGGMPMRDGMMGRGGKCLQCFVNGRLFTLRACSHSSSQETTCLKG